MDKTLAQIFLLMTLLILCLFGQASADTGEEMHQVDEVDPPYLFLLMVALVITLMIFLGVYLRRRSIIPSQECDTDSPHTICRPVDPLDSLPLLYRERTVYPRCCNANPRHRSTDTTFARNLVREVEVRFPCGSCDSDSVYLYNINVNVEPEGVAAMLEFTPNDEDDMLDEDEDHPPLFVGVSEYENSNNEV